jgi:hypothetical protein
MAIPNDMIRITKGLSKLEGSNSEDYDGDPKLAARTLIRRSFRIETAAVNANGSNTVAPNAAPVERMIANGRVLGVYFTPRLAATAAGADNAVLAVKSLHANGATAVTLATQTTNTTANGGTGSLVVGVPVELTVTDLANATFTKGTIIGATVTMAGNGVAMGAGTYQVDVELEGPASDYPI